MKKIFRYLPVILLVAVFLAASCQRRPAPKPGVEYQPPGTKGGPMLLIPAGEFRMGCNENLDYDCDADEKPLRQVELDAFSMDKRAVTQGEYDECVKAGQCKDNEKYQPRISGALQPVVGVDWEDAKTYCAWAGKRLPTEAEWEKAARGTDGRSYPWGNEKATCDFANFRDCIIGQPTPSGKKPAGVSPYGVMEMAGNNLQWAADWYGKDYYAESPVRNPTGPETGIRRVIRGGAWNTYARGIRTSYRSGAKPEFRSDFIGFRCAWDSN